jgi:hypothetical protein
MSKGTIDRKDIRKLRAEFIVRRSKTLNPYKKKIKELEKNIEEKELEVHNNNLSMIEASQKQDGNTITKLSKSLKELSSNLDTLYTQLEEFSEKHDQEKLMFEQEESTL